MFGCKAAWAAFLGNALAALWCAGLLSCASGTGPGPAIPSGTGQVYLYAVGCGQDAPQVDIRLAEAFLVDEDGGRHALGAAADLSSSDSRPRRVAVSAVEPRRYVGMVWSLERVEVRGGEEAVRLDAPGQGQEIHAPADVAVESGQSLALFVRWEPPTAESGGGEPLLSVTGRQGDLTGSLAFVTNTDDDSLTVVNRTLNEVVGSVAVGRAPMGIVAAPDGSRLYVANHGGRSISVVDPVAGRVVETIGNLGRAPSELALSRDGSLLLALNTEADSVTAIDTATAMPLRLIDVGREPGGLVFDHDRNLAYVADTGAGTLTVIDGNSLAVVRTVAMGQAPGALAVSGGELFIGDEASSVLRVAAIPSFGGIVAASAVVRPGRLLAGDGTVFLAQPRGTLAFVRAASRAVAKEISLGAGAGSMALDALHRRLYVVCSTAQELAIVDTSLRRPVAVLQVGRNPYGVAVIDE